MKLRTLLFGIFFSVLSLPVIAFSQKAGFQCLTESGFGREVEPGQYELDLLCQPGLAETVVIETGDSITVTVNLTNYYQATGKETAEFNLHFAMDRARIRVKEPDSVSGEEITDATAALKDLSLVATKDTYTFIVENLGFRSAVFDLSVRPVS